MTYITNIRQVLRVQIVREGALEPLIMSARNPSIEVQREAAAALCNLAMSEENKVCIVYVNIYIHIYIVCV
jgi:hypothetical protein